jgi:hypothetical protein
MHGNQRAERDQMHKRHEEQHQALHDKQQAEMAQMQPGGAPDAGNTPPAPAAPPAPAPEAPAEAA